jgi:hypothetical protein
VILRVSINGTDENPFMKLWGLKQNPFPQIAKHELMPAMMQLNSLGAEPIKSKEEIAMRLQHWSREFIELCQERYQPGKIVRFRVQFDEEAHRG